MLQTGTQLRVSGCGSALVPGRRVFSTACSCASALCWFSPRLVWIQKLNKNSLCGVIGQWWTEAGHRLSSDVEGKLIWLVHWTILWRQEPRFAAVAAGAEGGGGAAEFFILRSDQRKCLGNRDDAFWPNLRLPPLSRVQCLFNTGEYRADWTN